jgi:hypothetical protein
MRRLLESQSAAQGVGGIAFLILREGREHGPPLGAVCLGLRRKTRRYRARLHLHRRRLDADATSTAPGTLRTRRA